jgi:hypothetical protein
MTALHGGYRGFRGGMTLGQFLAKHRGAPLQRRRRGQLTIQQILKWADAHHARTGRWPGKKSGAIPGTDGEMWGSVCMALYQGWRGLPRSSLADLLEQHRGVRNSSNLKPLSHAQILQWADEHFHRTGRWPRRESGLIPGSVGETWATIFAAMFNASRGLPDRTTLAQLLFEKRSVPSRVPVGAGTLRARRAKSVTA